MLRHLKNANELVLYAAISCGIAFIGRIFPAFFFPILLLRLGVLVYCLYVIGFAEKNKELAFIIGGALLLGLVGGYFDLISVWFKYDLENIVYTSTFLTVFIIASILLVLQVKNNGKASKK